MELVSPCSLKRPRNHHRRRFHHEVGDSRTVSQFPQTLYHPKHHPSFTILYHGSVSSFTIEDPLPSTILKTILKHSSSCMTHAMPQLPQLGGVSSGTQHAWNVWKESAGRQVPCPGVGPLGRPVIAGRRVCLFSKAPQVGQTRSTRLFL